MFAFDSLDKHFVPLPPNPDGSAIPHPEVVEKRPEVEGLEPVDPDAADAPDGKLESLTGYGPAPATPRRPFHAGAAPYVHVGTPPIEITNAESSRRPTTETAGGSPTNAGRNAGVARPPALNGKNIGKKKRRRRGQKAAEPALTTVRGFTPAVSGDEDSESSRASTPGGFVQRFRDVSSACSSPLARPSSASSQGGISALKLRLDTLHLDEGAMQRRSITSYGPDSPVASSSATSTTEADGAEGGKTPINTYEVPLEHDFISPDVAAKPMFGPVEGGLVQATSRKMTAADFEPLRCLGKGAYGTVLLVRQLSTGRLFAQKQFRKASVVVNKHLVEQAKTERTILESINRHPFVVKLFYAFHDHEKLYLILEYAQGGELSTHLAAERMFQEDVAAFYMAEMVLALEHLHHNLGVVYRDLKPENILLDAEGHLLLTDFGLSKVPVDEDDHCKTIAGTDVYMAPEVILGKNYGSAVDWWSFGALGFDLLTGAPPFPGNNHARIKEKIVHGKLQLPYYLSPDAKDLLTRLLRKEPSKRLGWNVRSDVEIIKKHRFFRKIDWRALERRETSPPIAPIITDPALAENFSASFTQLAVSPVVAQRPRPDGGGGIGSCVGGAPAAVGAESDPFGGFSFVASSSLLEAGMGGAFYSGKDPS
ncbi:MAG: serine/threonine protein kinase psk1 [Thelocarpon impressellum]|nr:MAG: serine/threonine protein kinase psk1 [Thelocarpon impressellum]